jgi:hypothetical protein
MAKWAREWALWAQNPLGPTPGSPQWLAKHPEFNNGSEESSDQ